ncbi:MAG: glycosyltransferase [Clostridia bacterium]
MINVLYCGNRKMFDGILTSSLSIFKRTETAEPFHIFIFSMDLTRIKDTYTSVTEEDVRFLDGVAKQYNSNNIVEKIDVTELYEKEFGNCPNEGAYCSPYTLLRLLADLIPSMPEKLLYLDADVMFNRDITLLYNVNVDDYEYASARDHYGKFLINPNYINAGVLLLNMKKIKETNLLLKARQLIKTKKLTFADQDALYLSTTKKLMLPQMFNDQKYLHKKTIIRHFSKRLFYLPYPHTDNIKQWNVSRIHKVFKYYQFDDILYEYIYLKKLYEQKLKEHKSVHNITNSVEGNINQIKNKEIPIFFSCDDGYIPFLSVSLKSLEQNASKNYFYNIRILNAGNISIENQEKILKSYSVDNFKIEFVDITKNVAPISEQLHTRDYYSKTTYYRLFIPNLYPMYDKTLYLDSDIVVLGDISELFNTDLGDNYVGGINDGVIMSNQAFRDYAENKVGVDKCSNYFNAGILLMNLKMLRQIDFEKIFIELLSKVTFSVAQDQDYLNAICKGNVKLINEIWNKMPIPNSKIDEKTLKLIHYNLSYKPWHVDNVLYENYFWDYAKQTEYYKDILNIKNNYNESLQAKSEMETTNLIKKARLEADDSVENKRIASVIERLYKK